MSKPSPWCPRCDAFRPSLSKIAADLAQAKAEAEADTAANIPEHGAYFKVGYYEALMATAASQLRCHARLCAKRTVTP